MCHIHTLANRTSPSPDFQILKFAENSDLFEISNHFTDIDIYYNSEKCEEST
jgi:hypothetical protein